MMMPFLPMPFPSGSTPEYSTPPKKVTTVLAEATSSSCASVDSGYGSEEKDFSDAKRRQLSELGCTLDRKTNDLYRHLSIFKVGERIYISSNNSIKEQQYFDEFVVFAIEHSKKDEVNTVYISQNNVPFIVEVIDLKILEQFTETKNILFVSLYATEISCFSYEQIFDSVIKWLENFGRTLLTLLQNLDEPYSFELNKLSEQECIDFFKKLPKNQQLCCYSELSYSIFSVISRLEYSTIKSCLKDILVHLQRTVNYNFKIEQDKSDLRAIIKNYKELIAAKNGL